MKPDSAGLRKKAEDLLKKKNKAGIGLSEIDKLALIHELEVHQIELELQNEELIAAKDRAETATDKYIGLYDFAPTCYFTLTRDGEIAGLNLMASQLIGREREKLVNSSFGFFVSDDTRLQFNTFLEDVFRSNTKKICEVILTEKNQPPKYIHLAGVVTEKSEHCFLTAIDVTEIKLSGIRLQESERLLNATQHLTKAGGWEWNVTTRTMLWTDETYLIHDFENGELMPGSPEHIARSQECYPPESRPVIMEAFRRCVESGIPYDMEFPFTTAKGRKLWIRTTAEAIWEDDSVARVVGNIIDITDSKLAEEKIKRLLAEKELLLKEVHHRIKNNMNTIKGLLTLQILSEKNPDTEASLRSAESRVHSMIMLYDRLYCTDNYQELSLKDYLEPLTEEIIGSFPGYVNVKIETDINDYILNVRLLSPLGIIVNELLTNIMKYAFAGRDSGKIILSAKVEKKRGRVVIQDDGVGIPETVNFGSSTGFGLDLVKMLTDQIEGTIRIERGKGTRFVIEFGV